MIPFPSYRDFLKEELIDRQARNQHYSSRAFARDLGISPALLSQLLSRHKDISESVAHELTHRLEWSEKKSRTFVSLLRYEKATSEAAKKTYEKELRDLLSPDDNVAYMPHDAFRLISRWYHSAILELVATNSQLKNDPKAIAKRLGISEIESELAVDRLVRLRLLRCEKGILIKSENHFALKDLPSQAVRQFHSQMLEKAAKAIDQQPFDERNISGLTVAIDPKRLPEVSKLIRDFRYKMMQLLLEGQKSHVYHLGIQFFRLDKEPEKGS